jgi:hypothetical protein
LKENFDRFQFEIYKEKVMADFRKCVFAFAALALLLGVAGTANAQNNFQCNANTSIPALARSEGITELTGDILLNCIQGTPVAPAVTLAQPLPVLTPAMQLPTVNIRVFLNTAVTSRLLGDPWSEAVLLINDPSAAGLGFAACRVGPIASDGRLCNVYQGQVIGGNSVEFAGVPVLPPGSTGQTTYRITNVRANASAVAPGGSGTPGQIVGLISVTPATIGNVASVSPSFPLNNPQQIIGYVQTGLTFSVRTAADDGGLGTSFGFQQCVSRSISSGSGRNASGFAVLRYAENFRTAFKVRSVAQGTGTIPSDIDSVPSPVLPQDPGQPGFSFNFETGYYNPVAFASGTPATLGLTNAGLADFGTRLRAVFTNVPAGLRLFVTVYNLCPTSGACPANATAVSNSQVSEGGRGGNTARLVGSEIGAFFPVVAMSDTFGTIGGATGYRVAEIPIVSGTGTAVWEIMSADPLLSGAVDFGLFGAYTADVANNVPAAPAQATVSGSFAPITGPTSASATAPVPRFVDLGTATNLFRVNVCVTNLLFPFVTNSAGFDTGLAISNTSQDPFGTAAQAGTCTLNWYGSGAPAASPTPSVTAGTTWVNTVMNLAPNFQGYMIAQCRFQFAHGFAFISDIGARNLAMGYLALIIPADADSDRDADPFPNGGAGSGEQLGY